MSQMPIEPTPLDKILRSVSAVKTKGGFAALNLILVFSFGIGVLIFASDMDNRKLGLVVLIFLCWQGFAMFAFKVLPHGKKFEERQKVVKKENNQD